MRGHGGVYDRIPYVIVFVDDLERSRRFYLDQLGLPRREFALASRLGGVGVGIQGTTLILLDERRAGRQLPQGEGEDAPAPGHCYPSFGVPDLAAFHERATAQGVQCAQPPRADEFGAFAVYRDPDGLLFSVVQAAKPAFRHALVLSGGGALGAFELGVVRQLAEDPVLPTPEILTGTSVGAFNAAVLACTLTPERTLRQAADHLIEVWRKQVAGDLQNNGVFRIRGDLLRYLDPGAMRRGGLQALGELLEDAAFLTMDFSRRAVHLATSREPISSRLAGMFDVSSLLSTEPLKQLVARNISYAQLRASPRVLKLAATDWRTGHLRLFTCHPAGRRPPHPGRDEVEIDEENARLAVLASAAIPGVFPPVAIPPEGDPYVDGGVVMNSPLNPAIDAGADVIHLICLNPDVDLLPLRDPSNTVEVLQRFLVAAVAGNVSADLDRARFTNSVAGVARRRRTGDLYRPVTVHRYHPPPGNLGGVAGMLDFSRAHLDALIEDGVQCVRRHDCERAGCLIPDEYA